MVVWDIQKHRVNKVRRPDDRVRTCRITAAVTLRPAGENFRKLIDLVLVVGRDAIALTVEHQRAVLIEPV